MQCTSAYSWKVSIIDAWQEKEYPQSLYQTGASHFSYSTKRKHNRNTKTSSDETDLTKTFQSKWSFCQAVTLPLCGGKVLLNSTVKYSVVPTTRCYYINGDWLQKDGGTKEPCEWQPGSQTAVKDDATQPTTHSLKSARRQTKIEEHEKRRMKQNDIKKNNKRKQRSSHWLGVQQPSKGVTGVTGGTIWTGRGWRTGKDWVRRKPCPLRSATHPPAECPGRPSEIALINLINDISEEVEGLNPTAKSKHGPGCLPMVLCFWVGPPAHSSCNPAFN